MTLKQLGVLLSISTAIGINIIPTKALAQEPSIQFSEAISQGSCTIENQLASDDGRTLAIAFKDFKSANGQRNKCILRINTTIPSGFHVQDVQVLYQGSAEVASGGNTSLNRSYTFAGGALGVAKAPPKITKFTESNPLFQEQDDLTVASASCGGTGQLGMNMLAGSSQGSTIYVDTADVNAGDVRLHIDIVPCQ
ncbi:MAG: hypothetical protein RLZZ535_2930 [Cyanobacteriota bacterium]|jgi:hypothetical protein